MWIGVSLGTKRALFVGPGVTPYVVAQHKEPRLYWFALTVRAFFLVLSLCGAVLSN
jgi:hypothetical protein